MTAKGLQTMTAKFGNVDCFAGFILVERIVGEQQFCHAVVR